MLLFASCSSRTFALNTVDPYWTVDGVSRAFDVYYRNSNPFNTYGDSYSLTTWGGSARFGVPFSDVDTVFFGAGFEQIQIGDNVFLPNSYFLYREEFGHRSVTIEGIAAEAGVGKQTIYRWWPSKAAVVLEAFARRTADRITMPDTGSVQGDLEVFLGQAFEMSTRESGQMVRSLMSEALLDVEFSVSMRDIFIASRRRALRDILIRGIKRGEYPLGC